MADTFKYAEMAEGTPNAAQEFLKEQLSKNRYTKEQVDRLNASGGATVGAGGEGVIGKGPLYDAQNPTKNQSSSSSSSGGKLKGTMNAEQVRAEFGLSYDGEKEYDGGTHDGRLQNEKGDIWYKENGQIKYLGNINESGYKRGRIGQGANKGSKSKSDIGRFWKGDAANEKEGIHKSTNKKLQAALDEYSYARNDFDNGFNSINDVGNAMRHLMDSDKPTVKKEEEPNKPIEYSDEIKQAVSRVRSYENDVLSGKTSQEIYGNNNNEENDNKYTFDMNKGIDGIGTEGGIMDSDTAAKSTENFLQSKKSDIMKKYQFKAA